MHIKRIKKKDGVYLSSYESYREDGKVKTRFIEYLGKEGDVRGVPLPKKSTHIQTPLYPERSKSAGDVKLMWTIAEKNLNMSKIIDKICCGNENIEGKSPGKILTAWAINKATNPVSATNLSDWVKTTVIPDLFGIPDDYFTDSAFYTALDRVCFKDNTADGYTDFGQLICDELFRHWRLHNPPLTKGTEILAYDLTPVLIFGSGDDLGEKGYNSKKANRKQINLCVLVSKLDKTPVSYFILPGNFNSMSSVKDLLVTLIDLSFTSGTLIWDRGNTSEDSVKDIEKMGWKLICGVPTISNEAISLIEATEVPISVSNLVKSSEKSALYAKRAKGELFGRQNAGVVYVNLSKRLGLNDARNKLLKDIGDDLDLLIKDLGGLHEKKINEKISELVGNYEEFFKFEISPVGDNYSLKWEYDFQAIDTAAAFDGKYLLYSTDTLVKPTDVVKEYIGKDFVEKTFETMKSYLKIAPVRHWRNTRIRAFFFINMMALWLRKVYELRLNQIKSKKQQYGFDELLRRLRRVSYVEIECEDGEKAFWYLNLNDGLVEQLKLMGFKNLFDEKRLCQV
ncbi:MAG: transposase [Methanomicrobiales archaeon]|nr:transposase [Methanomicrobiales archaeon]